MNVYFNRRKDPKRYEEMFLWSNLSELDAKYLQLIIITRTPVHTASYGSENLTHKSSYLWRTQTQGDGRDLYLGLLPSVVTGVMQPPGPPISPWTCQSSQTSLLANPTAISLHMEPQRDAAERWGGASTRQKCLLNYLLDANERSGRISIVGESLNRIGSGWIQAKVGAQLPPCPKYPAVTAARTKPGAFMKTEEDSPSWPLQA